MVAEKSVRVMGRAARASCAVACAFVCGSALGSPVTSKDFFSPYSPTITQWEVDGAGAAVTLLEGGTRSLPAGEYASSGFTFGQDIAWVNDSSAAFNGAQLLVGSLQNAIPSGQFNTFDVLFTEPTDAFGFVVVNSQNATTEPAFTAYDAQDNAIETVTWGAPFQQGVLAGAEYGFMGIWSEDAKIARVRVTKQFAILDDFYFATVPGPGGLAVIGCGVVMVGRRRR